MHRIVDGASQYSDLQDGHESAEKRLAARDAVGMWIIGSIAGWSIVYLVVSLILG
ncbi:MAG TPA: hypothetical protein VKY65_10100 [Alphaproteobacteria bacterium]|nr:hypothetical protein [Alphaproteobacteria bacterium]